ncbi:OmpA family protein [Amphritea sp. HPY]|uniref:OmpA family protein n=1 Tax=Amphritea sp. HPY TaxID=3421652 RepID=UPI003D7EA8AF
MKKIALTAALAMAMGISATVQAHPENEGYATNGSETVWKTGYGECWQHGFWKAEDKTEACGAEAAAPAPAPAPAPAMKMALIDAEEKHIVYFDFDSSQVTDVSAIVNYVGSLAELGSIELKGYTDRIGSNAYNDALSQRRVEAVDAALAASGINTAKTVTHSYGEANPVKACTDAGASTKSCLAENRRVEVSISGKKQVHVQQ